MSTFINVSILQQQELQQISLLVLFVFPCCWFTVSASLALHSLLYQSLSASLALHSLLYQSLSASLALHSLLYQSLSASLALPSLLYQSLSASLALHSLLYQSLSASLALHSLLYQSWFGPLSSHPLVSCWSLSMVLFIISTITHTSFIPPKPRSPHMSSFSIHGICM